MRLCWPMLWPAFDPSQICSCMPGMGCHSVSPTALISPTLPVAVINAFHCSPSQALAIAQPELWPFPSQGAPFRVSL